MDFFLQLKNQQHYNFIQCVLVCHVGTLLILLITFDDINFLNDILFVAHTRK